MSERMISREILEVQRDLYTKGRQQAIAQAEQLRLAQVQAVGQVNMFSGSLDAIDGLLKLLDQLEAARSEAPEDNKTNKEESNATVIAAN